jgi:DNA-directed RNA polymerase specialized sigma24 family protein
MEWFHSTEREQTERTKGGLASSHEIQAAFAEQRDYLYWLALLITGDGALAELAVVNASALSANYSSVFRDWLVGWATYATVRAAVREVRDLISASASHYVDSSSELRDDDVLSDDQILALRNVDPRDIVAALDSLARSALVLRGIQHASMGDCALLLDVPRRIVGAAYCQALRWNSERTDADGVPHRKSSGFPSLSYTPAGAEAGGEDEDIRKKRTDAENKSENAARNKINPNASWL